MSGVFLFISSIAVYLGLIMQELDQTVTIGATVPTGFEHTAAEEVQEKLEATARVSKNRGRIYFDITTDKLFKVSRPLVCLSKSGIL